MNFLAHIYLSGYNKPLMIGNFIGDHVKGNAIDNLPEDIRKGVILHRKIDAYTDSHSIVMESKMRLRPLFRKYAPVVTDMYYDHFLAVNWSDFSDLKLSDFAEQFYKTAEDFFDVLPDRTRNLLPYMKNNNWLVSYATIEGVNRALTGMARRTPFNSGMENAAAELELNYKLYENEFNQFFIELEAFSNKEIKGLL